jgi:dinuclear metal center YbgI/SA1388 family protein
MPATRCTPRERQTIGAILGISRQTAHGRFGGRPPGSADELDADEGASLPRMADSAVPTLRDVVDLMDGWYPPDTADGWDAVGLVAGDPAQPVTRVLFAVDPAVDVAREAAAWGADLLVVHHPLFLRGVHGFAETTPKGRTLATLARAGCALLTAHTNADRADPGVSDALAVALGLTDVRPLRPQGDPLDKLTVYVPPADADRVRRALAEAGAGRIGDYEAASFSSPGEGRFRPMEGASPTIGEIGELEVVGEERIEVVLDPRRPAEAIRAMLAAHPYETPAWDVVALSDVGTATTGAGRVGEVEPTTLGAFAQRVAGQLPQTARGVLVAGDRGRAIRRVAVAGGAGDFLLGDAFGAGVDVFVTSDLRHHPATEFVERGGPALVDVSHWAAEWTWLPQVEARLMGALDTVETRVSTRCTDAWNFRA